MSETRKDLPKKKRPHVWPALSLLLALAFLLVYYFRPFSTEALTVWPSWLWGLGGLVLTFPWRKPRRHAHVRVPLFAWALLAVAFSEVWRIVLPPNPDVESDLRVATINCAGEMAGALREVAEYDPDVILLQESAHLADPRGAIRDYLGSDYFGVLGLDASVFVKGRVLKSDVGTSNHTIVTAELEGGRKIDIVSLRLQAPHVRLDYWTKDCWKQYANHRRQHIEELTDVWKRVQRFRTGAPLVMGGDFNLIPDPKEGGATGREMVDSYRAAGRGWYGTALSSVPWFRIDKVWCSSGLVPVGTWSRKSAVSDHRFVVADFRWTVQR